MNKYKLVRYTILGVGACIIALIFFTPVFIWTMCRIEPNDGEFAVLIRKTGTDPDPNKIIAGPGEKGLQLEELAEGRHYRNPYDWDWQYAPITDIPPGRLGILTRLYGNDLPLGEIIAKDGTKGILPEILGPGKYRINPLLYTFPVPTFPATPILSGNVGVQVSLTGADPLNGEKERKVNTFTVDPGEKGVITSTLDAATYYINPYLFNIIPVNLQSSRFEMSGDEAIDFLTMDGFTVKVEGTLEYALTRDKAALLTHEVGDNEDILKKIILPRARGFGRIEGSKGPALNYIVGEMRQEFQDKLTEYLKEQCKPWGVEIRSVLVRNITPPDEIASVVRDRELAKQAVIMFEQQIIQAESKANLGRQEMLAVQSKEKVDAETKKLQAEIKAKQEAQVRLTAAEQTLSVSELQRDAAKEQAAAIIAKAKGEQNVIKAENEAQSNVLIQQTKAFGTGDNYARYLFYKKVAPNIESILANDDPQGMSSLFMPFLKGSTAN